MNSVKVRTELPLLRATRRAICAAGALWLAGCAATAPDPRTGAIAELGATGKLRAAINFGNPILASRDAAGEPRGVSVDLAREAVGDAARPGTEDEPHRFRRIRLRVSGKGTARHAQKQRSHSNAHLTPSLPKIRVRVTFVEFTEI